MICTILRVEINDLKYGMLNLWFVLAVCPSCCCVGCLPLLLLLLSLLYYPLYSARTDYSTYPFISCLFICVYVFLPWLGCQNLWFLPLVVVKGTELSTPQAIVATENGGSIMPPCPLRHLNSLNCAYIC
jgi:hypothetical protein